MRDIIYCITGESGSGKSTVVEKLQEEGFNWLEPFTDRERREGERKGYTFVNSLARWIEENPNTERIAETCFGTYSYWSTRDKYQGKGISFYIVDPQGVKDLRVQIPDAEIVAVYLKTDEFIRKYRLEKDYIKKEPNIEVMDLLNKISSRVERDKKVFRAVPCDYMVDNNGAIEDTLAQIIEIVNTVG